MKTFKKVLISTIMIISFIVLVEEMFNPNSWLNEKNKQHKALYGKRK